MSGGPFGVTPSGFVPKQQSDIVASVFANLQAKFPKLNASETSQINTVVQKFAADLAAPWAALAAIYNGLDPSVATGPLLAGLAAISGTRPQVATYSTVTCNLTLAAGVTVNPGAIVAVAGQPQNAWTLVAPPGTPAGQTAPVVSTTAGTYQGVFRSSQPGPFVAVAGTITSIVTPVSGWTAVTNPADAAPGLAADTDESLRNKRTAELSGEGAGCDLADVRAAVEKVPGVIQAFALENTSLYADVNGLPGKSFRVIIYDDGASNNAIAQAIWNHKPAGIQSYGATMTTATDSQGNTQDIFFDRVSTVPLYVNVVTTPGTLTTPQTSAIKAALVAYADDAFTIGGTVFWLAFAAAALSAATANGAVALPTFQFGTAPSPTGTVDLPIGALQIATLSSTDILVNGV